jgi:tRNA G18 (ribose-2'-O)-methylase SpoU
LNIRRQLLGTAAIESALERGEPLQRIVVRGEANGGGVADLLRRAQSAGVPVQRVTARHFRRLRHTGDTCDALGLLGPAPDAELHDVLRGEGSTWHLVGVAYPGNAGMAIRTAEVSGAAAVFIDADFDRAARRAALRASMRADRFMPVFFGAAAGIIEAAAKAGRRIVALEDSGDVAPWDVDLAGRVHFVVGGEADGIPDAILAVCDAVVRIPTPGFVPSYNLQAAVAAVASERLRQVDQSLHDGPGQEAR